MNILFFLTPKSEVAYIPADESLRQAFEKLKYHGYSAVPTLTDDGKYAGTITEGDVLRAMESMCHWNISEAEKVKLMDVKRTCVCLCFEFQHSRCSFQNIICDQIFADDGDYHTCRSDILLYTAIDDAIFGYINRLR